MAYALLGLTLAAGYLIGGVPFGWLVARGRGVDILRQGSGNIGATNVGRVLGRRFGALVFALDCAKGALPVLAASFLPEQGLPPDSLRVAAGAAAFLGHLFPVYLRFRGGKGVATGVGVVAVLLPLLALLVLAAWVVVLAAWRYVSVASLAAAALLSVLRLALTTAPWSRDHIVATAFCLFGTVLVSFRHAGNIRRLVRGSENRLKDSPAMLLFSKIVHVLALGLWFGAAVFFVVAASVELQTFDEIGLRDKTHRPLWFPLPPEYEQNPPSNQFPDPLREEQGSRAFGAAVGPVFPWYFGIQAGCGVVALITALGWWFSRRRSRLHGIRVILLALALAGVALGWWMERVVADLRGPRDEMTDAMLQSKNPLPEDVKILDAARGDFVRWHGYGLLDNFVVLLLAGASLALAAQMPSPSPPAVAANRFRRSHCNVPPGCTATAPRRPMD
jgi:acyl-phosphate glycerol 3-phosphate acyltransferase